MTGAKVQLASVKFWCWSGTAKYIQAEYLKEQIEMKLTFMLKGGGECRSASLNF